MQMDRCEQPGGACDRAERGPGRATPAWQLRLTWESSHVAGSGDTGKKTELDAGWTLVSRTPTKGLGLWAREQMGLGQGGSR